MRGTGRVFWLLICALFFETATFAVTTPASLVNVPADSGYVIDDDDDAPDVTAPVARISFIRGEAKIKRADSADWENATLNLPIVEGDEIATDPDSRIEIQFDTFRHARLSENSFLRVAALKDDGIALSLSLGTINVRITSFDKEHNFFEVDAPKTTLAVQKAGSYRIDAGQTGDSQIRIAVTEGGEARIYSETAGFTLKNNRSARVFIDGDNAGEWEAVNASRLTDEFDRWALDRDTMIARRLSDAYYGKYYDQDIYGADDLTGYGDWVYTSTYGHVWRPSSSALSGYADWSPYRYGHWRWIAPYGWVWINDEPWGWATYHHGRWFYDNGYWYWSPYGYYRHSRSWWFPALVAININIVNNSIWWYPLPYHCHYYNYNGHNHHGGGSPDPVVTGGVKPPIVRPPTDTARPQTGGIKSPPITMVPTKAVIATSTASFGTSIKGGQTAPVTVANSALAIKINDLGSPQLPIRSSLTGKIGSGIVREKPRTELVASQTKVGAATREQGQPLDKELRATRVFGGRPPVSDDAGNDPRPTGAVTRPPVVKTQTDPPTTPPIYSPPTQSAPPVKTPPVRHPQHDPPVKQPAYSPPVKPSYNPSPQPVKAPPRSDPPTKSQPNPSPPTKSSASDGASSKASSKSD